ncbi:MAG: hypothetical protein ABIU05_24465, partial [Nitrospirales bacterium]
VPLNHANIPKAMQLLNDIKDRINLEPEVDTLLVPSPGMTIDSRLGQCSACEDYIEQTRKIDLETREAQLRQAKAEAERFERRLSIVPPHLDNPKHDLPSIRVHLDKNVPSQ